MGTFGLLRPDDKDYPVEIKDCHVNLWSLDGLFGRRVLLLDVGVQLRASAPNQQSVAVIVPAETAPEPPADLVPLLRDADIRTLIFAQTVPITNDVITVGGDELELLFLNERETKLEVSDDSFSQWHIHFARSVSTGRDSYARFRFRLRSAERLWEWRRSGLVRVRAVVDFRVGDIRGVAGLPDAETLALRALPIGGLNLFVIAPLWLRMRSASPALKYMRLLEGTLWERYLNRATKLGRREKLIIYQWEGGAVNTLSPYRAFLDLGREPDVTSLRNHFAGAMMFMIVTALTIIAWANSDPLTKWSSVHARLIWKTLVGALSVSVLLKGASWIGPLRKAWHRVANEFERLESWLFHVLRR